MCQLSAKNLIWNFLWNVSNFALIFYLMHVLHKKSRQSLRHSPESFRWDFLLKIGTHIVKGLTKNVPLRKVWDSSLAPLTGHSSDYQGGLFNKQELVWVNYRYRVYMYLLFKIDGFSLQKSVSMYIYLKWIKKDNPEGINVKRISGRPYTFTYL